MHTKNSLLLLLLLLGTSSLDAQWLEPDMTSRPWTRWWWHGSAVDEAGITRELENFSEAGFGGVEITPIYGVQGGEADEKEFLSPEWLALVKHACLEARRLGLGVDIVPGTGWRLGHEGVPEGERAVVLRLEQTGTGYRAIAELSGERVKRPAPGGSGYTLDMLNRDAVRHYLEWFNEQFFAVISPALVRGVFHDSWEYETDWTHDMDREIFERTGLEVETILPALDPSSEGIPPDTLARWRYAYRHTLDELLLENFCEPWNTAAHQQGLISRNQAHGSIANLLDVYARADIPETEIFRDQANFLVHKFASSAAHVSGRKRVSAESFTWLSEHWTSDLAKMRKFADYLFLCGINHIFYHGTAYSPEGIDWPGWVFYASAQINDRNPLWHHLPELNTYITRSQGWLQSGKAHTEVYLYWPIADLYASRPGTKIRQNIDGRDWFYGSQLEETARLLWEAGVHFDYISDLQLIERGQSLEATPVVLLPPLTWIPLQTVEALDHLAVRGTRVLALNDPLDWRPPATAGILEHEASLRERVFLLLDHKRIQKIDTGSLFDLAGDAWQQAGTMRCIRRDLDDGAQLYFITNWSERRSRQAIPLGHGLKSCERMDPWTGRTGVVHLGDGGILDLVLEGHESTIIRTGGAPRIHHPWMDMPERMERRPVDGPWTLSFVSGGPGLPKPIELAQPDWIPCLDQPDLDSFAGVVQYSGSLELDRADLSSSLYLDLGDLASSARVFLNGDPLGTVIRAPFRVYLPPDSLTPGNNRLIIEVATLAANRIRAMDQAGQPWRIFKDINFVNIEYKAFDASNWPVRNYGLKGPVQLMVGN